jgi:hypothetical protein
MKIRAFRYIGDPRPVVTEVACLILEKNDGTPVAAATEIANGLCAITTANEPQFKQHLKTLGLDELVIVEDVTDQLVTPEKHRQLPLLGGSP